MIYIYLEGHDFEYEVRELVKVFFFNENIIFIHDEEDYKGKSILVKNILSNTLDQITSTTMVYIDSKLVSSSTINDIQDIEIERDTLKKR